MRDAGPGTTGATLRRVVVLGGGVAGLETALALRRLAPGATDVTLVTPAEEYVEIASTVGEPFGLPRAPRVPMAVAAARAGAALVRARALAVDPDRRQVHTDDAGVVPYDELVVALGARRVATLDDAVTVGIDPPRALDDLVLDLIEGYDRSLAVVVPPGPTWSLPAYDLALLVAREARTLDKHVWTMVVTPEAEPLELFGHEASARVRGMLDAARVDLRTSAVASRAPSGGLTLSPSGERLEGWRVLALPALRGPALPGLPATAAGFLPVDDRGAVRGAPRVHAVGDAADWPVKHGSLAAQEAAVVAHAIASAAGAPVTPLAFAPVVEATLMTGEEPLHLQARPALLGARTEHAGAPADAAAPKVAAPHLGALLRD